MRFPAFIVAMLVLIALPATPRLTKAAPPGGPPLDIKIGMSTPLDAKRNGSYVWTRAFADVMERAGARVRIYPNSALGGEKERMDQVAIGRLEINETGGDELARLSPLFHAMRPFEIESYDHLDRLLEHTSFLAEVNQELADDDLILLDYVYTGDMVGLFTRGKPVRRIEDLRSLRLRILSAADLNLLEAWKVRGVRVAWEEVAQALQTGMVDAYLNPPIVAVMFGHGNVLDYFTDLRMGPSTRLMVTSRRWYESLSPAMRTTFARGVREARAANRAWNATAMKRDRSLLEKTGIEWIEMKPGDREAWKALTRRIPRSRWETPQAEARLRAMIEASRLAPRQVAQ
ncbi:MAG: TRAP transporter substrate-binding protein DctP [Steroidobacteraceae bacterium]|jgi:TRAP-type C4-dicarboxylate transport system substrate-binding protein